MNLQLQEASCNELSHHLSLLLGEALMKQRDVFLKV
jgi:hypothetical protein